ncbi:hypothetical protein F5Y10DRAFT_230901 [Nemania abortiva]|nr:hypothetical protein F5Y10DRAFT_230901 [Nemania abortiva]
MDVILDAGRAVLFEVAPLKNTTSTSCKQDLHSFLYPQTHAFRLETIGRRAAVVPIDPKDSYTCLEIPTDCGVDGDFVINDNIPQYSSKEISVVQIFMRGPRRATG